MIRKAAEPKKPTPHAPKRMASISTYANFPRRRDGQRVFEFPITNIGSADLISHSSQMLASAMKIGFLMGLGMPSLTPQVRALGRITDI